MTSFTQIPNQDLEEERLTVYEKEFRTVYEKEFREFNHSGTLRPQCFCNHVIFTPKL